MDAWAGPPITPAEAKQRCNDKQPLVNERDGRVVGFIELDPDGHIDCAYVDPAYSRMGIMSEVMGEVKKVALAKGLTRLFAEVSKTARPFFEYHGFVWVRASTVYIRGASLGRHIMECKL